LPFRAVSDAEVAVGGGGLARAAGRRPLPLRRFSLSAPLSAGEAIVEHALQSGVLTTAQP
jgi:hypothetical protein